MKIANRRGGVGMKAKKTKLDYRRDFINQARRRLGWVEDSNFPNRGTFVDRANIFCGVPPGSPYCASSISYLLYLACVPDTFKTASSGGIVAWGREHGAIVEVAEFGDVMEIRGESATGFVHTALIVSGTSDNYKTIEFNEGNGIRWNTRRADEGVIVDPFKLMPVP